MLENRPIVQKSVYGTGAFAFVFLAAMAGTAFMISGGAGGGDHGRADPPAYSMAGNWAETQAPEAQRAARVVQTSMPATANTVQMSDQTQLNFPDVSATPDDALTGAQGKPDGDQAAAPAESTAGQPG